MNGEIIETWSQPGFKGRQYGATVRSLKTGEEYDIDILWTPDNGNEVGLSPVEGGSTEVQMAGTPSEEELLWFIRRINWDHPYKSLREVHENPYIIYAHVGFCLEEFIKLAKAYKEDFTSYCEIVITENGLIFLASPRHADIEEWLHKKRFRNICKVWYDSIEVPSITKAQQKVLDRLKQEGLIKPEGL